jgi:hypothetical protein
MASSGYPRRFQLSGDEQWHRHLGVIYLLSLDKPVMLQQLEPFSLSVEFLLCHAFCDLQPIPV